MGVLLQDLADQRRPIQVPRETSRQNQSESGSCPISGRRLLIPTRGATSTTRALGDADAGALGGQRPRPMSFARPDSFPHASEAHAARAPAAPARTAPARTASARTASARTAPARAAPTAGGAGERGLSGHSTQRRECGLFHVEPGGASQPAFQTWRAEPRSGASALANPGAARMGRPRVPSHRARPRAERTHHARRLSP